MALPNAERNAEVAAEIATLKGGQLDLGASTEKHIGIANALASLNVAESLQIASLQIEESSSAARFVIQKSFQSLVDSNEKLSASNGKYAKGMMWFTGALVIVGIAQIVTLLLTK